MIFHLSQDTSPDEPRNDFSDEEIQEVIRLSLQDAEIMITLTPHTHIYSRNILKEFLRRTEKDPAGPKHRISLPGPPQAHHTIHHHRGRGGREQILPKRRRKARSTTTFNTGLPPQQAKRSRTWP